jgi:hypothetical protein
MLSVPRHVLVMYAGCGYVRTFIFCILLGVYFSTHHS